MKNFTTLVFLSISVALSAQKVSNHSINFDYQRLPLYPLSKEVKSYQSFVYTWKDEANKIAQQDYERQVKEAEERYQKELDSYEAKYKRAEQQYEKEMAEYNRKSRLGKVVDKTILEDGKPIFNPPPKPRKPYVERPKSSKADNLEALANEFLKMDGYKKGTDNPVFITAEIKPFDYDSPTQRTVTEGENQRTLYEVRYRQPVKLTVESMIDGILYSEIIPKTNQFYTHKSYSPIDMDELERKAVRESMQDAGNLVQNYYDITRMNMSSSIMRIDKHKKHNYDDCSLALQKAISGYNQLYLDYSAAVNYLSEAITIWEKALQQYNPSDKKARINRNIAWYLMLNIAEANLYMDNFDLADQYMSKLEALKPGFSPERVNYTKNQIKTQKERYLKNMNR